MANEMNKEANVFAGSQGVLGREETGVNGWQGLAKSVNNMGPTSRTTYKATINADKNHTSADNDTERKGWFVDWGTGATRSIYNTFAPYTEDVATKRNLLASRLWKGVPQLTDEMMGAFDAAFTGHTFFFVRDVPRFMYTGIYANTNMHQQIKNLKAIIERACIGFSGANQMTADGTGTMSDGNTQLQFITNVSKRTTSIQLTLHEFAGLPVKNAIETWLTGIVDPLSRHGSYHGNLGIPGGWCLQNHTMSLLVVHVDPSWTEIMDAAYYNNMMPTEVPNDVQTYSKQSVELIGDANVNFICNEHRSPAVMKAAEVYMNNRILSIAHTAAFNSREFVPDAKALYYGAKFADGAMVDGSYNYNYDVEISGSDNATMQHWPDEKKQFNVNTTNYNGTDTIPGEKI